MIKAIAIDDEPLALKVIESFSGRVDFISLEKTFNKPLEGLRYVTRFPVDLLFLDINMPSLSGLDLYREVKQNTMVIFTTAFSEFAVEGFNLHAVDYLLKPFTFERFAEAVNKAKDHYQFIHHKGQESLQHVYIRADYTLHKIDLGDILYIEGLDDYLRIHLQDARPIVTRMTIKGILEKLPRHEFLRVHRSYIVPLSKIDHVRNKVITMGKEVIPIGASYEKSFFERFGNKPEN